MSIDTRYQNSLTDMITLLQQAVFRFITDLQVDLNKFFQFFKQFHRNLVSLEDNFHQSKVKYSKYLTKLHNLTQQVEYSTKERLISLEPEKSFYKTAKSKDLKTETVSKLSQPHEKTEELNVIGEIQEREQFDELRFKLNQGNRVPHKSRVGTAEGSRHKMSVTIDFQNSRPYTGSYRRQPLNKSSQKGFNTQNRQRYRSLTKYQKVADSTEDPVHQTLQNPVGFTDQPSQPTEKKVFNINQKKTIYEVLEQEKRLRNGGQMFQSEEDFLKAGLAKLPEKRKNKSWARWSFKINKLL